MRTKVKAGKSKELTGTDKQDEKVLLSLVVAIKWLCQVEGHHGEFKSLIRSSHLFKKIFTLVESFHYVGPLRICV